MEIYRLYLLNPRTGGIDGFEDISSADDAGAIALAATLAPDVPTELWLGSRKVGRFDPPLPVPASDLVTCAA